MPRRLESIVVDGCDRGKIRPMPLLIGLLSWLAAGLVIGLLARRMLPGEPRLRWGPGTATGLAGALLGGLLATALGFGGMAAYDLRSLVTASLGAVLCQLLLRYFTLA